MPSHQSQMPMLRLRTLGTAELSHLGGQHLGPAASQRRLLALLAVLAASPGGISRERVLLLLWPDQDPEKARHALTQSLYHARRSLDCDDLFVAGSALSLNLSRISSDVGDIDLALRESRWSDAAAYYTGPFLDDFQLAGAGEFERWATTQRMQLSGRIAEAYARLAEQAAHAGDSDAKVEWRRRALLLDPLNTGYATRLVEALVAAGDRTGALREALRHETLLREELDLEPDARFVSLIQSVRAASVAPRPLAVSPPTAATVPAAEATPAAGDERAAPRITGRSRIAWISTGLAVAAIITLWMSPKFPSAAARGVVPSQRIVVAPFRTAGADAELGFLRDGMVELLGARLGDDGSPQTVDAGAVIQAWREGQGSDSPDGSRERAVRLARGLGASSVVTGSVIGTSRRVHLTASLLDAAGSAPDRSASVEGPADSLTTLVDRLAVRLLILEAEEDDRIADRMSPSLRALRAYLEGQSAYRRAAYQVAVRHYEHALVLDSGFALAAFQLALAADRLSMAEQHDRALAIAWANRLDLSDRDRAHLIAFAGPRYPEPSSEAEQLAAWEAAIDLAPDRSDSWLELAQRFLYAGRLIGVRDPERRAARAAARALELDPTDRRAEQIVAILAARLADTAQLRAVAARSGRTGSQVPIDPFVAWRTAHSLNDRQALARVRAALPRVDDVALRTIALSSQYDAVGPGDGERVLRLRRGRPRRGADRLDDLLGLHSLALNQGRPILALDLTEQIQELQPASRAHLRLRVLDGLYGGGDSAAARLSARQLERHLDSKPKTPYEEAVEVADICVVAQWQLQASQLDAVRRAAVHLRRANLPTMLVPVGANPRTCAALLEAGIAVQQKSVVARAALLRLDSLMLGGPAVGDASAYAHIWIARMWEDLGERALALDAVRRRPYMSGWPRYLATARREEGRLAALAGDRAGALRAYREYLVWRPVPEPDVRPEVSGIRAAEAALQQ